MPERAPGELPSVSVIVPCRNEAALIRGVVRSLLAATYPRRLLQGVFVDGMSTDGTRRVLEDSSREHAFIRVVDNPGLTAPSAMNAGIRASNGEIVLRLDAHSKYAPDYIARCVRLLLSGTRIGSAGGRCVPVTCGEGQWARAVAYVTAHRFGVGNSAFRVSEATAGYVDTVALGTFWRAALEEVGLYDERLTRNQDNELHERLRRAGYAVLYDSRIIMHYRNKTTLRGLLYQGLTTAKWNVYTMALHPYTWRARRFAPLGFVIYLAALGAAAACRWRCAAAAGLPAALYALLLVVSSAPAGAGRGGRLRVAFTFFSYHLAYGLGPLVGLVNIATGRWRRQLGKPLMS